MARRDNQGIQIAMIVFILTTLLFMVTTYFGYSSSTALKGELEKAKSDLSAAEGQRNSAETLATDLKTAIGIDPATDDAGTKARVAELTAQYGQGLLPENQNLLGIIQERTQRVTDLSQQLATAAQQNQQLRVETSGALAAKDAELANAKAREAEAHQGFSLAMKEKNDYIAANDAVNKGYLDAKNQMKIDLDKATAESQTLVAAAQKERDEAIRRAQMKQDELNVIKNDTPDQYDGRVLGVVPATKTVLLDVGRADGIMPKVSFTIYDSGDNNVRTATKKASVEVTRVLGAHRCEARITDTDYVNPIVRNDFIYSPVWSPGTRIGIALLGDMDYDQDGLDDREYLRSLIERNGGRIDAEDVDGVMKGTMTVDTRYIVVGEGELMDSANDMLRRAKELTIERMSVDELLDLISPPGRARSIRFGKGAVRPSDFAPEPYEKTRTTPSGRPFRQRAPLPRRERPRSNE